MAEPFKNAFNEALIQSMGLHFHKAYPNFDQKGFTARASVGLEKLELKDRSAQIATAMAEYLPKDFEIAGAILMASLSQNEDAGVTGSEFMADGIAGWAIMPMTYYVGLFGLNNFCQSMALLREMTKRFSSEFGIRFFLLCDPDRTLEILTEWAYDPNRHVRRLVSEGTRPRLPWAQRLPGFIADPSPILPLLDVLKDDDEEYVRRSVANNLNDIAKDHPNLVASIAGRWIAEGGRNRERLVRHACRTLVKQGHTGALKVLGYDRPKVDMERLEILTPKVDFGEALEFDLALVSTGEDPQPLIIDYAIHHRKANGKTSPKVFKWKSIQLGPKETHKAKRNHFFRKITTRTYYPGPHKLEVFINGVSKGVRDFELVM